MAQSEWSCFFPRIVSHLWKESSHKWSMMRFCFYCKKRLQPCFDTQDTCTLTQSAWGNEPLWLQGELKNMTRVPDPTAIFPFFSKIWICFSLHKMDYVRNFLSSRHFTWLINLYLLCLFMALVWKTLHSCCNEFTLFLSTANEAMAVSILKHISTLNYGLDYYHSQPSLKVLSSLQYPFLRFLLLVSANLFL